VKYAGKPFSGKRGFIEIGKVSSLTFGFIDHAFADFSQSDQSNKK
jgi:hypothetical protein